MTLSGMGVELQIDVERHDPPVGAHPISHPGRDGPGTRADFQHVHPGGDADPFEERERLRVPCRGEHRQPDPFDVDLVVGGAVPIAGHSAGLPAVRTFVGARHTAPYAALRLASKCRRGETPAMTGPDEIREPDDHAAYRADVRAWYDANATPKKPDDPWATNIHVDPAEAKAHFDDSRAWVGRLYEAGYSGIAWPAAYGGGGGEAWMTRIEREIAGDYEEWTGFPGATIAMLGPTLLRHGTEEQKKEYIPKLLSAELTFCQLFSEPNAGSDLASLGTRAVRDGDEFVVNGQKVWNSSAQFTDWGFLLVRTNPDAPKHKGITFLLVDMATPGIEVRPLVQINKAAHFNEVFLNDVRIPVANVVGEIDEGWGPARTVLSNESAFIAGNRIPTGAKLRELATLSGRAGDPTVRQDLARYISCEARRRMDGRAGPAVDPTG
ncbi:MAG: acyl-CoA dehydrogenase family protein [Acidimicrobiales bacterium]